MNNLWGRPPGLSGWACSPRIVMKTPRWGRPSACGGLSGRPDALSITYGGFSTVRGSSRTRSSRQAGVDAGRRTGVLPYAAMLLCAILAGCGGSLTRNGPIDPALAVFIPPDTVALAGVRMDRLRATPIYRKLAERNRLPRFDQFRTESGFDPSRDLHEILLAGDGKNVLAIAHGAFPPKPPGNLKASEYKGYTLYAKDRWEAIAFIDKTIALGGLVPSVRAAIDQYKRGGRGAPRDLMARAQALPADAQIWAVVAGWRGATPDQLREMGNLGNLDRVLRLVEGANLTVDLRTGVHAALTGDSRTEADAKTLADSLRGLAALARMGAPRGVPGNQPDLLRALDGIQVKQAGRVVQVNVDIAEDLAEKLVR